MPFDRLRFPTLALFLDRVGGLAALPECQAKASVLRELLTEHNLAALPDGTLPAPLLAFARQPPPMNVWISEVLSEAGYCAVYDLAFTSAAEATAANVRTNLRLMHSPMYRALMVVMTPTLLLRAASVRWSAFHRGSTLTVREAAAHSASAVLEFPPHLFIAENPMDVRGAIEAALIASGGKDVTVKVDDVTSTSITYRTTF
jgi:hypothetical protein